MKNSENNKNIVCYCSKIDESAILKAVENGAKTLTDIRKSTGACTLGLCKKMSPSGKCCSYKIVELLEKSSAWN